MDCRIGEVTVHYAQRGDGAPLVALHGAGVDHREIEAALEPTLAGLGLRRIYPDLPGMGHSTAGGLAGNGDVVALLAELIERVVSAPVLLLGHSYGGYLARSLAAQRPDVVRGLALVCPVAERTGEVPDHHAVVEDPGAYNELDPAQRAGFDQYFVIRTRDTARRYRDSVVPGRTLVDEDALGRVFARWPVDMGANLFSGPTLIAAGRRDATVGCADAVALLARYPRATLAVIDDAGHALMHEQPDLLAALLRDWIRRADRFEA